WSLRPPACTVDTAQAHEQYRSTPPPASRLRRRRLPPSLARAPPHGLRQPAATPPTRSTRSLLSPSADPRGRRPSVAMANTLRLYLTCIRNTLEAAMCLQVRTSSRIAIPLGNFLICSKRKLMSRVLVPCAARISLAKRSRGTTSRRWSSRLALNFC
uniref:Uncharacterized protein n=1 Tax=Triticum urartu TaxID=4572 RepID=A0A8R7UA64_TRIUA